MSKFSRSKDHNSGKLSGLNWHIKVTFEHHNLLIVQIYTKIAQSTLELVWTDGNIDMWEWTEIISFVVRIGISVISCCQFYWWTKPFTCHKSLINSYHIELFEYTLPWVRIKLTILLVIGWLYIVGWFMVFNASFNNISVISWQSVLLVQETGVNGENHRPVVSYWQTLSHNVVSSTQRLSRIRTHNMKSVNWPKPGYASITCSTKFQIFLII